MTTIRDVAQAAAVSAATVSHVIHATRFVSDALGQRGLTTMDHLGYLPNALARNPRHKRTHTLGMILPASANPFFAEIAHNVGFNDVALASFSNPPLTRVCQPRQQMGEVAIDPLLARIKNRIAPPQHRVLPTQLIVRRSST